VARPVPAGQAVRRLQAALPALALACALHACEHSGPGSATDTGDVGPRGDALPRRLTFYEGDDVTPSVTGASLVFSRQSAAEPSNYDPLGRGREACLAFLPVVGGTIQRQLCPDRLIALPDTFVDTWYEPALSPDGSRLAFLWKRGPRLGALAFHVAHLVVTAVDRPADTTQLRLGVHYLEAGDVPRRANIPTHISWVDDDRVRFLATFEHIVKVKGGGSERVTDTLELPLALMELDVSAGTANVVPGGDSVVAYAPAPDGAVWVVRERDPSLVLRLDPVSGTRTPVGQLPSAASDIATVGGVLLAIVGSGGTIVGMDPGSGVVFPIVVFAAFPPLAGSGPARRLAAAGGRRFVVQIDREVLPWGSPADLWLWEIR